MTSLRKWIDRVYYRCFPHQLFNEAIRFMCFDFWETAHYFHCHSDEERWSFLMKVVKYEADRNYDGVLTPLVTALEELGQYKKWDEQAGGW